MNYKDKLNELRTGIDKIDEDLVKLFEERLEICDAVADVKGQGNIPVTDTSREKEVINKAVKLIKDNNKADIIAYVQSIMSLSTLRQNRKLMPENDLIFPESQAAKKDNINVGFQGVAGAWGEQGAIQMFPNAKTECLDYFEDVFTAVKNEQVDFGVVPIENSQTGAIGEVYDLLRTHGCYIVGQTWVEVAHCLLANKGAEINSIREVFSHPEGFRQCHQFLKNKNWDLTASKNTAIAAQSVAQKDDKRYGAIGSRRAAELYNLDVIASDIIDNPSNRTRFISIAKNPIYDNNSETVSITFSTAHKSGALCMVLQAFMLAGINLSRIESRPVNNDKYRFFADLQANILNETTLNILKQASVQCDYFEILGCY